MLAPERWQAVEALFHAALAHPPAERAAFLASSCGSDEELRSEVESLLSSDGAWDTRPPAIGGVAADWVAGNEPVIGREVDGYRIVSAIGVGGMGEVFLADDLTLGRRAALKLLPVVFRADADRLRRFEQEARTASGLNHPNIVTVYQVGDLDGRRYIATEFIEGQTLRARLAESAGAQPLPTLVGLDIAIQVTRALRAAHDAGIVHRDIKPENLMIRPDGYVKVLDFGLAKLAPDERLAPADDRESPRPGATRIGAVMGTPVYMAPEQAKGAAVDARADLYSLGVVIKEMFAGQLPGALARALEVDPDARYQTAAELLADLEQLRAGLDDRPMSRRTGLIAAAATLIVVLGLAGWLWRDVTLVGPDGGALTEPTDPTLAVLPFALTGFDPEYQHLGLGVADELVSELSGLRRIHARPTADFVQYAKEGIDPVQLGSRLKIDYILSGSIARHDGRVVLEAKLTNVKAARTGWTEVADIDFGQVVMLRNQLAQRLSSRVVETLAATERVVPRKRKTQDEEAYRYYLEARAKSRSLTVTDRLSAIPLFEKAIARDPDYADAFAGLAETYRYLGTGRARNTIPRRQSVAMAKEAALKALALDDTQLDAYLVLGTIQYGYDWDWPAAEAAFRRAATLSPGALEVDRQYGWFLVAMGRFDDGLARLRRASERDPDSLTALDSLGAALTVSGRQREALAVFATALKMPSNVAPIHWRRIRIFENLGQIDDAVRERELAALANGSPDRARLVRQRYEQGGYRAVQQSELEGRLENAEHVTAASIYVDFGDFDQAFDQLGSAVRERNEWSPLLRIDPQFAPLRADPRFASLLVQVGLDPIETPNATQK